MTTENLPFKIICRIRWKNSNMADTYEWPTYAWPEANTPEALALVVKEELGRIHQLNTDGFDMIKITFGMNEENDDEG
jgi:hypothetical protein